jgi:hypothetical protein
LANDLFYIRIVNACVPRELSAYHRRAAALMTVRLGSFQAEMQIPIYYWSPEEYEAQWTTATKALADGADRHYYLIEVEPPSARRCVHAYIGWRVDDQIRFHERYISIGTRNARDEPLILSLMGTYSRVTPLGDFIHDEWPVPISEFARR